MRKLVIVIAALALVAGGMFAGKAMSDDTPDEPGTGGFEVSFVDDGTRVVIEGPAAREVSLAFCGSDSLQTSAKTEPRQSFSGSGDSKDKIISWVGITYLPDYGAFAAPITGIENDCPGE